MAEGCDESDLSKRFDPRFSKKIKNSRSFAWDL
jgi:hypothetical protein